MGTVEVVYVPGTSQEKMEPMKSHAALILCVYTKYIDEFMYLVMYQLDKNTQLFQAYNGKLYNIPYL